MLAIHLLAGWPLRHAVLLTAPWCIAAVAGLVLDPWLTHRLLRGVPLALALLGGAGLAVARAGGSGAGALSAESLRILAALGLAAFLLRAARRQPSGLLLSRPAHARAPGREGAGRGPRLLRLALARDLGARRVADRGLRARRTRFPTRPPSTCPSRSLPVGYDTLLLCLKLRGGRGLDRADLSHLGPGPAPRGVRAGGGPARADPDLHVAPELRVPARAVRARLRPRPDLLAGGAPRRPSARRGPGSPARAGSPPASSPTSRA